MIIKTNKNQGNKKFLISGAEESFENQITLIESITGFMPSI